MKDFFLDIPESAVDKKFRIKQIKDFVFKNGILNISDMTNIPMEMRTSLGNAYEIVALSEVERQVSVDGTVKFLFKLNDGLFVESVFLIDKNERVTFCISSQVGCRMGCVFCQTGKMGLERGLTAYEILSEVVFLYGYMVNEKKIDDRLFNIVFMGMGEPFDNYDNLIESIKLITDRSNFGLSPSRITVSTCGIIDKIEPILDIFPTLRVAVSLNNPIQEKREKVMPIAKKFSLTMMAELLNKVYDKYKSRITLEYVLIKNSNMGIEDIDALELFNSEAFHINVIPLNHSDDTVERPEEKEISLFISQLEKRGFCVTRRYRRGADIQADCGQLYHSMKNCERGSNIK